MQNTKLNRIIESLKIGYSEKVELDRLIKLPALQAILNADETEQIENRKKLINELAIFPEIAHKLKTEASAELVLANQRYESAKTEYHAATESYRLASLNSQYADYAINQRAGKIERELIENSDLRIGDYRHEIKNLRGRYNMAVHTWCEHGPKDWRGRYQIILCSNHDDLMAVKDALNNALEVLTKLALSALTSAQITQNLKNLTNQLRPLLAKLDMNPPTLDENEQVKEPERDGTHVVARETLEPTATLANA